MLKIPTNARPSEKPESPVWVPKVISMSKVLTEVKSSDTRKFWQVLELLTDLIKNPVRSWPFGFQPELF
jgi:hypothetical protein